MKATTTKTKKLLENESFDAQLENLKSSNPNYSNQEVSVVEMYKAMKEIKNLLLDSIENGNFEKLPFHQRNAIYTQLNNVHNYSSNIHQILPQFNSLENIIHNSRLYELSAKNVRFDDNVKEINSLRIRYKRLEKDLSKVEDIKKSLEETRIISSKNAESISHVSLRADELKSKYNTDEKDLDTQLNKISNTLQEIENRKKEILAFSSNIGKNEERLKKLFDKIEREINLEIVDKIQRSNYLISEAETALELKQTEGIAAAYSSRLKKISESNNKKYWLLGAVLFVTITILFALLLTGITTTIFGQEVILKPSNNVGFIIGRIALTAIGISGAVFCANRFVILRNLEEDYEYKVVLTKSILAFANKIKDIDNSKVAEYLTHVLNELHQDPLRNRKEKGDAPSLISIDNIDKIAEVIQKIKPRV